MRSSDCLPGLHVTAEVWPEAQAMSPARRPLSGVHLSRPSTNFDGGCMTPSRLQVCVGGDPLPRRRPDFRFPSFSRGPGRDLARGGGGSFFPPAGLYARSRQSSAH
jgi:hypothetical protein